MIDRIIRWFEMYLSVTGWILSGPPKPMPEPVADKPFSYPPGLDTSAFFFRLDLRGNPRDIGFEWAWMRPLLPVPAQPVRYIPPSGDDEPEPQPRDEEFEAYMESEYVTLDEYRAVQRGELPDLNKRLHDFDDRYQRPVCRCGRSHPELSTPLRDISGYRTAWDYKGSFYKCNDCGRKWQTGNLKAALAMKPLVKPERKTDDRRS